MVDGGPGLPVFGASVFHYIATNSIVAGCVEDVPDPVVRQHLSLVSKGNILMLTVQNLVSCRKRGYH